ncbi:MAG: orotidine 5'-phosphate decarboxylase [Parcubacteria group bacterium Gr01-1014_13]|nr:MAG: orotidine 5'-phosphate decarboxylase [Parcubacteria group bacterium Gr01-1014_13]
MTRSFKQQCEKPWAMGKYVCVGLDPDFNRLPTHLKDLRSPEKWIFDFLKAIVDSTVKVAAAFKPNYAFFEKYGDLGVKVYVMICQYIKAFHKDVVLICDSKRGDIGDTNVGSADFFFERCNADAVTVNGYLGPEALEPFLNREDKGVFILCRTSNSGSGELQNLQVQVSAEEAEMFRLPSALPSQEMTWEESQRYHKEKKLTYHMPLYQYVAARVSHSWNKKNNNCGLVTGATYAEDIYNVRHVAPDLPLLIPGIGKQGGDLEKSVRAASSRFFVNSSSAILYASQGEDFAEAALAKTFELDSQIRALVEQQRWEF